MKRAASIVAFVSVAVLPLYTQAPPAPQLRSTATGVLIDVTVLDRDGRPVLDLTPADFEVTEDGKVQQVLSAPLIHAGAAPPVQQTAPGNAPPPTPAVVNVESVSKPSVAANAPPTVTAILFDRLSPEVRPLARTAALAYVATLLPPHDYAGIFVADLAFTTFQPFTSDPADLRRAIDRVAATGSNNLSADAERMRRSKHLQGLDPSDPPTAGAESAAGFTTVAEREKRLHPEDPGLAKLIQMELRMEEGYTRFLTEYEGDTSLSGLRAVVNGLALLPGRKSILYFTESLPITARLKARFDALIGQANRTNIAIYPVDTAGLRVHSKEAEVGRNVTLAGAQGLGDAQRPEGAWTKDLEKQEQVLSSRPTAVLGRLAKETGGFLLENTNDLGAGVARMQMERTTYYLLGYQSTNAALDGSFRRVNVKVKRSKVTVRARAGYLAVPVQQ